MEFLPWYFTPRKQQRWAIDSTTCAQVYSNDSLVMLNSLQCVGLFTVVRRSYARMNEITTPVIYVVYEDGGE